MSILDRIRKLYDTPDTRPFEIAIEHIKLNYKDDTDVINVMEIIEECIRLDKTNKAIHEELHKVMWYNDETTFGMYKPEYDYKPDGCKFCKED